MDTTPAFRDLLYFYNSCGEVTRSNLRFGQWFIGNYMPKSDDNVLFMEPNMAKAMVMIYAYYEQYQWEL
jgi:hypothetical protein